MKLNQSSNPVITAKAFEKGFQSFQNSTDLMSINGVVNKSIIMLVLVLAAATFTWNQVITNPASTSMWMIVGAIGGLVLGLVTIFKMSIAHITAPLYAIFQGLFVGALSSLIEGMFPGIPLQAVMLTFGTFFGMLFLYRAGIIRATKRFRAIMFAAIAGIGITYFIGFIMSFFGITPFYSIGNTSLVSIGFSIVVVVIAALSLILDFDTIEQGIIQGAPKQMEWYSAFGLMMTLIWLYIEILRLLTKLQSRD